LGNLGVLYTRSLRFGEAVKVYTEALRKAPDEPDLHLNLGLAWLKQGDHKSARPYFERAVSLRSESAQARELLATTLLFTGDEARAIDILRNSQGSSALYLTAVGYLRLGKKDEAAAAIKRLFAELPEAQARVLAGRAYYESTLFDEALAEFLAAQRLNPELPGLHRESGKTYVSLRRADEARAALRQAVKADPSDVESAYFLGALLVGEGQYDEGVALLTKAQSAWPDFWGVSYYLARAAMSKPDYSRAVDLYRRASYLRPDEPSILYGLSRALKGAGKDEESRQVAQRVTALRQQGVEKAQEALVER
jgi:tetratricopeptide (TPR) repeat protein